MTNPMFLLGDSGGGWTTPFTQVFNPDGTVTFTTSSLWLTRAGIPQATITLNGTYGGSIFGEAVFELSDTTQWVDWVNFNNKDLIPKVNRVFGQTGYIGPLYNYNVVTSKPDLYSNITGDELAFKFLSTTDPVYQLNILIQAMSWASQSPPGASPDIVSTGSNLLLDWKTRLYNEWRQLSTVKTSIQNGNNNNNQY